MKRIIIGVLIFSAMVLSSYADEQYGDIRCTEKFIPVHKFECRRPDMSLEKVFQTYQQMIDWYDLTRDLVQPDYTWTVSNMGI